MAHDTSEEKLSQVLTDIKEYQGLTALAAVLGNKPSRRTLYRHTEPERPPMDGHTKLKLIAIFDELGLLGDYGPVAVVRAVEELQRRATLAAEATAPGDEGSEGEEVGAEAG